MKLQIYTKILSSLFKSLGAIKANVKERRPLPKDDVSEDDPIAEGNEKVIVNKPTEQEFVWHDLKNVPRTKERGESKGDRDWKNITGITIHQTACQFGNNPQRVLNVPVHETLRVVYTHSAYADNSYPDISHTSYPCVLMSNL